MGREGPPGAVLALRWMLGAAAAAMCGLAFAWPFAVSADPSHPVFKTAAIATLVVFLASVVGLLACRARRT